MNRISVLLVYLLSVAGVQAWTFTPFEIGTNGTPFGYWEFLPAAYDANPTKEFPVVFFFHGKGENGDGTLAAPGDPTANKLQEVLVHAVPKFHNDNSNADHAAVNDLLELEEVITLSPQTSRNAWTQSEIRSFVDYAIQHYRIDSKRIYLTGLSNGSRGIHVFVDDDPNSQQITAIVASANRGKVEEPSGLAAMEGIPYWALTGQQDSSDAYKSVNNIAGALLGTGPTILGSGINNDPRYPRDGLEYTALFDRNAGTWSWQLGIIDDSDISPKLTIYPNAGHSTWNRTYKNLDVWGWLLEQVKPTVTLTQPSAPTLLVEGQSINLQASAVDKDGVSIAGSDITWFSNIDGELGSGSNITVSNLGIGVHEITCQALDSGYRAEVVTAPTITVVASGSYTILADFGDKNILAPGNWNHLTHEVTGLVENAIDDLGNVTGVRIEIEVPFSGRNSGGTTVAGGYPVEAKQDSVFTTAKANSPSVIKLSGLNPNQTFDFTFFGSRNAGGNRLTFYQINGQFVSLETALNENDTEELTGIVPSSSGEVFIEVYASVDSTYSYLGLIEITTDAGVPNVAPVANNDIASVDEGLSVNIAVLGNDNDPDAAPSALTISSVGTASNGSAVINGSEITYTPNAGFYGVDSFTYTITDGADMDSATVQVTVNDTSTASDLTAEGLTGVLIGSGGSGSSRVLLDNSWEVNGSGAGVGAASDNLHYEYQNFTGNFQAIVRVNSLASNGTNPLAGLMLRETLDADARMVAIATTTGSSYATITRDTIGASSTTTMPSETYTYPDGWVLIERQGDNVYLAVSSDGNSFNQVSSTVLSGLSTSVAIGVFSNSGSVSEASRAVFTDYSILALPNGQTVFVDFGPNSTKISNPSWNDISSNSNYWLVTNAVNDQGIPTGFDIELIDSFATSGNQGEISTIYPELAGRDSLILTPTNNQAQILVSNLDNSKTYDFSFFASIAKASPRFAIYTIGTTSMSLDAAYNQDTVVMIDGVSPVNGEVLITVTIGAGTTYAYTGVLEITEN
ncbi:Ig-like domain-containing protein [Rubellicoccus peritrichatus]|uniref:Ig-like domain-containing protein n=1 Tax=Rubellicoccus peritrichatus TaxID=3080537 RepID=A0AAQ3QVC7_9BACT|nr:Ig-like domain-containing protein [Puniceicoccus sp. CR14]WOO40740.1 Ig-like domain-containing protein [Puniceicoccus sp. CR14]